MNSYIPVNSINCTQDKEFLSNKLEKVNKEYNRLYENNTNLKLEIIALREELRNKKTIRDK